MTSRAREASASRGGRPDGPGRAAVGVSDAEKRRPAPPEVELHKEILRLTDLLDAVHDEEGRRERRRELDYKLMKFNMMRRKPVNLEILPEYRDRVEEKLSR